MPSYEIDGYQIRVYSSRSTSNVDTSRSDTLVFVYDGNVYRGALRFYPDGTDLPAGSHDAERGRVKIHLNLSQFAGVMDTLRLEKPLYVYGSDEYQFLHTGKEPVGEEEAGGDNN